MSHAPTPKPAEAHHDEKGKGAETTKPTAPTKAGETVDHKAHETGEHVKNLVPEAAHGPTWKWEPLMAHAPSAKKVTAAGLTGLTIAAPPLGITATAATLGAKFGYDLLHKYPPFSWIDKSVKWGYSHAKNGAKSVLDVALAPAKMVYTLGKNVLVNGKVAFDKAFNLATKPLGFVYENGKWILKETFGKGWDVYLKTYEKYPKSTIIGTVALLGGIANGTLLSTGGKIISGIGGATDWVFSPWSMPTPSSVGNSIVKYGKGFLEWLKK